MPRGRKRRRDDSPPKRHTECDHCSALKKNPEVITRFIVCLVVMSDLPLSFVSNSIFRDFIKHILPWYEMPERTTLTRLMKKAFDLAKEYVKKKTSKQDFFSCTFDMATVTNSTRHFIVITVHYYDKTSRLFKSLVLGAKQLLKRSTANEICSEVKLAFDMFGVEITKIGAVCTDGGSNVTKACKDMFGHVKHIVCACHIMDNAVKASLKSHKTISEYLSQMKSVVRFFKQSYVAANLLRNLQIEQEKIKLSQCLMLIQSVPTRWNSILHCVQRYTKLRNYVNEVLDMPTMKAHSKRPEITDGAVDTLSSIVPLLEDLEIITKTFSSNSTLVSSNIILNIVALEETLKSKGEQTMDLEAKQLQEKLSEELETRFENTKQSTLLGAANLLDPRLKGIGLLSNEVKAKAGLYLKGLVNAKSDGQVCAMAIQNDPIQVKKSSVLTLSEYSALMQSKPRALKPKEEVDDYLGDPTIGEERCPLQWWLQNEKLYPILSTIAINHLTIPVSSVASERTVSCLNRILSKSRTRLSDENVNMLVVLSCMPKDFWNEYLGDSVKDLDALVIE